MFGTQYTLSYIDVYITRYIGMYYRITGPWHLEEEDEVGKSGLGFFGFKTGEKKEEEEGRKGDPAITCCIRD